MQHPTEQQTQQALMHCQALHNQTQALLAASMQQAQALQSRWGMPLHKMAAVLEQQYGTPTPKEMQIASANVQRFMQSGDMADLYADAPRPKRQFIVKNPI